MKRFLIRRSVSLIPTLLIISVVVFSLVRILPGDPAYLLASVDEGSYIDPQVYQEVKSKYGLDKHIVSQYFNWLWGVVQGDWGTSFFSKQKVFPEIVSRLGFTAQLALISWILSLIIGIPLGIISALKRNSPQDLITTLFSVTGIAIPNFWLGAMLIFLFGVWLGWLPTGGYESPLGNLPGWARHMILPTIVLSTGLAAMISRHTRSALLEALGENYIQTARAKGLRERDVVWTHAFRNSLLPVVTISCLQLGKLIGGTVVTESIFALPGLGKYIVDAVVQQDYLVVQMGLLTMALAVFLTNLLADILYAYLDPRIRY